VEYGRLLGNFVKNFIKEYQIKADFVASHGHTVFHQPDKGFTAQIGDGAAIAAVAQLPVVCDFRTMDVALGGQGAPLVPIGDKLLFSDYHYCLNIGGIANISFDENGTRKAFDISPANMALNYFADKIGLPYDKDGELSKKGQLKNNLFQELNALDFYQIHSSKSLGREWFETFFLPIVLKYNYSVEDSLRTLVEHIAFQIGKVCKKQGNILITGGGAKNKFLIECIFKYTPSCQICIPDTLLIDYKEALIFAFLGLLRMEEQVNCLKSVTGAGKDSIGGAVYCNEK
jgi:anhydro-N-acetylmuramic acid kinase